MKDYEVKFVDLKTGERLAYREAGQGDKTIVLIHGNLSSSVHYQPLMEELEDEYHIYAPDVIGFGDSTYNRKANSLKDFSDDIVEFIEIFDLKDIYLMGWSTGGGIALEVAASIPDRIRKLFLQSSVGIKGYPLYKRDKEGRRILSERIYEREDLAQEPIEIAPGLKAFAENNREFFRAIWGDVIFVKNKLPEEDMEKIIDAVMKERHLLDVDYALVNFNITNEFNGINKGNGRMDLIKTPIVIFHGDADNIVRIEFAKEIKEFFGDRAEFIIFEGCGHSIFTDDMDKFLYEFTSRLD